MNRLTQQLIRPLLETNSNITKIVGIYGGRFQPFGPHHLKTFKWLKSQVDDAYIVTSNIKKPPRHPMNFNDKVKHITKMGVKKNQIVQEKNVYQPINALKKYNPDTTAVIFIVGEKDSGRLSGGKYFKDYKTNKNNLMGFKQHGYTLIAPHTSMNISGKEVSGTSMRELLGSQSIDDKERIKLFKKMFGYYNKSIFDMMTTKFTKLFEITEANVTKSLAKAAIGWKSRPEIYFIADKNGNQVIGGEAKRITTAYSNMHNILRDQPSKYKKGDLGIINKKTMKIENPSKVWGAEGFQGFKNKSAWTL